VSTTTIEAASVTFINNIPNITENDETAFATAFKTFAKCITEAKRIELIYRYTTNRVKCYATNKKNQV